VSRHKLSALVVVVVGVVSVAQLVSIFKSTESGWILQLAHEQVVAHEVDATAQRIERFEDIDARLRGLDFKPQWPRRLSQQHYPLVSARKVVVLEQRMLQLRCLDLRGGNASLFISPVSDALLALHNKQQVRGEWLVSYWREGELFYSLVTGERGP